MRIEKYKFLSEADDIRGKEKTSEAVEKKIVEFFSKNPSPEDEDIHQFAADEGINKNHFEEIIYGMLGSFFSGGKSRGEILPVDQKQLEMGIKVEMEHTDNVHIATKIAMDHLVEDKNYYSHLKEMEDKYSGQKEIEKDAGK